MVKRKIFLHVAVMVLLLTSLALAFGVFSNGIGRSSAQGSGVTTTEYWLDGGYDPWGVTFDSSGNVWVAVPDCDPSPTCPTNTQGNIEEFNPTYSSWIGMYTLPTGYTQALFMAFDAQGNLWFPMPMSNSIGMLNPKTQAFQQFPVPTPNAGPWDIAIDHNGNIWFTEHFTDQIGEFNPTTQKMQEFATPTANSLPYGIVVDSSNNIWFTENDVVQIGEYTAGGVMEEYKIQSNANSNLTPHLITVDPNGNIWWTEGWVGMIGELKVAQAVPGTTNGMSQYAYPVTCTTCGGTHTSGISVDSYGQIWFDDSLQGIFGSFPDSGTGSFSIYTPPTTNNAHTHDGLAVDSQNRIWITEEFANKLAEAVQNGVPTPSPSPSPSVSPSPSPSASPSPSPSPSPGTTLAQDTFQRANQKYWGTASDGLKWGGDANTSSVFSITNNTGQLSNGSNPYNAVLGLSATNAEVIFSGSINKFSNSNLGAALHWLDGKDWYKAYITGGQFLIQKDVKGTMKVLKSISFTATANTSYTIDFEIIGTSMSANVWKTGTPEPSGWMITATDSSLSSGYCGLRIQLQSGDVATITSFLALSH